MAHLFTSWRISGTRVTDMVRIKEKEKTMTGKQCFTDSGTKFAALAFLLRKMKYEITAAVTSHGEFNSIQGIPHSASITSLSFISLRARAYVHTLLQWDTEENQCMRKGS